ncbi:MAG: hypothetical protein WCT05_09925, partial [Lentisphaeria bacterium]
QHELQLFWGQAFDNARFVAKKKVFLEPKKLLKCVYGRKRNRGSFRTSICQLRVFWGKTSTAAYAERISFSGQ